jgi:hypothetical protein
MVPIAGTEYRCLSNCINDSCRRCSTARQAGKTSAKRQEAGLFRLHNARAGPPHCPVEFGQTVWKSLVEHLRSGISGSGVRKVRDRF